jgi:ABC-type Na+ efflux pump permease subunit
MNFLRTTLLFWRTYLPRVLFTKRMAIVVFGCALPALLTWMMLTLPNHAPEPMRAFMLSGYVLVLQLLVPLASVIVGSAVISEEIDDRTITYLFTRPIPRATLLLGRWLASATVLVACVGFAVVALGFVVEAKAQGWKQGEPIVHEWTTRKGEHRTHTRTHDVDDVLVKAMEGGKLPDGALATLLVAAIAGTAAYSALFAALGTMNKHPMIVGLGYSFAIEGFLANLPGTSQSLTIQYYLRSYLLSSQTDHWTRLEIVNLEIHDTATEAMGTLGVVLVLALAIGSIVISRRQYVLSA